MKKLSPATRLTIGAITVALSVACMYLACVLPTGRLALMFLTSLLMWVPLNDRGGMKTALLCYLATALLGFFILPNKLYAVFYALFFGVYGFIKLGVDFRVRDKFLAFFIKLLIMNLLMFAVIAICSYILKQNVFSFLPDYNIYIAVGVIEICLIAFEIVFSTCIHAFDEHLRYSIIPRQQ